jgi:CelD/BcsL family acetyltransferase involved in cellulose biosynthesis
MGLMRKQSSNLTALCTYPEALGYEITREQGEVVYHLELPGPWEEFFPILSGKERHELRRKMRRLSAAGRITYQVVEEKQEVQSAMDTFIRLFRMNRPEKSRFMNSGREKFFRMLAEEMAKEGILKLFFLEIDGRPAASVMCFDYGSTVYLYNNGYDNHFETLSVGLLCKVFSIKHSIERGKKKYDFLKGGELYKSRLGSTLSQLVRCQVKFYASAHYERKEEYLEQRFSEDCGIEHPFQSTRETGNAGYGWNERLHSGTVPRIRKGRSHC